MPLTEFLRIDSDSLIKSLIGFIREYTKSLNTRHLIFEVKD